MLWMMYKERRRRRMFEEAKRREEKEVAKIYRAEGLFERKQEGVKV